MPTVLRTGGFSIRIRTRDHGPPHVHVFHGGDEVVILLGDDLELPSIRDIRGMPLRQMRVALELVAEHQKILLEEWKKIYE
ncbi:MAG TPA: DUF4160 domain-containing protein [Pyrinomonadaceae bacterium]|nr:DUF4160 domain-containing protein [Pyrinomonadaceae bacterium]